MIPSTRVLIVVSLHAILLWNFSETICNSVRECTCEPKGDGVIMHCIRKDLLQIPTIRFTEYSAEKYYELNLENNLIENITDEAFNGTKFKRIVLSKNAIKSISKYAFVGLETYLEELLLTFNEEMEFPVEALQNLTHLKLLEITHFGKPRLPEHALSTLINVEHLVLSHGNLQYLIQQDLRNQNKLANISLEDNKFSEVPEIFKTPVGDLTELNLKSNAIAEIHAGDFEGIGNLIVLDISQNPFVSINVDAFASLENSLEYLICRSCHLTDAHLDAVKSLVSLRELNISGNDVTAISSILQEMKSLSNIKRLDVQRNQITTLTSSVFEGMSDSLQVLDLSDNPLTSIDSNTFTPLKHLRELQLNNIGSLKFDQNTFATQNTTLRILGMNGARFLSPPWSAISPITTLQVLLLSNCSIDDIPEFTFKNNGQLADLDLSVNKLTSLTQKKMTGLQNSLVRIVLSNNSIETLDECIFHQFENINFLRFWSLNNNPLRCDCALKWLYNIILKPFRSVLIIKCANGSNFFDLAEVFDNCPTVDSHCESLLPSTILPSPLRIVIDYLMSTSISISWTTHTDLDIVEFVVTCQEVEVEDNAFSKLIVSSNERQYVITGLELNMTYKVCVIMKTTMAEDIGSCIRATTSALVLSMEVIIGISVGASIAVILILFFIAMFIRASRQRETHDIILPQKSGHSKRYVKHQEQETLGPVGGNKTTAAIVQKLAHMSDEERYHLVNMLEHTSGSADNLDTDPSGGRRREYGKHAMYSMQTSMNEKHFYDEIPDDGLDTSVETTFIVSEAVPDNHKTKNCVPSPPPRPAGPTDKLRPLPKLEGIEIGLPNAATANHS